MAGPTKAHCVVTMSNWFMNAASPLTEMDFLLAIECNFLTVFHEAFRLTASCWYQVRVWLMVLR